MRALAGEMLLRAWEEGAGQDDLGRPLTMLALALPDRDPAALADVPLAERNRLLLRLRELSFGPQLAAVVECSACGAQLEFSLTTDDLVPTGPGADGAFTSWTEDGRSFRLRPLSTADLLPSLECGDLLAAEELLLSRCVTADPPASGALLGRATVLERFELMHLAAELRCAVACPECAHEESVDLDIGRFLWSEVRAAASRLLHDIDILARAYGWSEQAILALSDQRRGAYLELAEL